MSRETYHTNLDKILDVFTKKTVELEEEVEVTLEEKTLEDGTVIRYADMEVGTPVMVVDAEGVETPAPDGEYQISENETMVVMEGAISEVVVAEITEAKEDEEEEMEKEDKQPEQVFNLESLKEKVDFTKEGFHTITFSIANGKIEWGNIYSESFQELKAEKTELETQLEKVKANFEDQLKVLAETVKQTSVIQAPIEETTNPKSKVELMKERLKEARKEKLTN